jgi:hypothetical protein
MPAAIMIRPQRRHLEPPSWVDLLIVLHHPQRCQMIKLLLILRPR